VSRSVAGLLDVVVLVTVAASAACYQYHDASPTAVRPEETVHVVLSGEASTTMAGTIGPNATSIDGRVMAVDSIRMRLAVTQIARGAGPEEFMQSEPIDVPTTAAVAIRVRSVDRVRTFLAAFGGVVAGVLAARTLTSSPGVVSTRGTPSNGSK
jgi:hypothetical protein